MGVVHLARDDHGNRVALKMLRPHVVGDDEARGRLEREVGSLARIRSRWVAEIVDADPWAPVPYVAMRYVPGLSLHDDVRQEGPPSPRDLLWIAGCLAEGLSAVHAAGVVHRDVKPSNVLLEGRTPILIDFGLARVADDPKLTMTGWLLGTPGYLAPEILYGDDATPASDLHSWGATIAYTALGRPPFGRGPSMAVMDRVRQGQHDLAGFTGPLRDLVEATLAPEPHQRPTLEEVLAWLRPQTTQPHAPHADPVPLPPPAAPEVRRGPGSADPFEDSLRLAHGLPDPTDTVRRPTEPRPAPPAGDGEQTTHLEPTRHEPAAPWPPVVGPPEPPPGPPPEPPRPLSPYEQTWQDGAWPAPFPEEPPVPLGERLRRGTLAAALGLLVGAAIATTPWVVTTGVLLLVWLLRSGSIAASAVGERRRVRGRKWYDAPQLLIRAPWHLVQSVPGTGLLILWGLGLASAAMLVCYAVSAAAWVTLCVGGVVLAGSLWWGPGGGRVRSPVSRVLHPAARRTGVWVVVLALLLLAALLLGAVADARGPAWTPFGGPPFS